MASKIMTIPFHQNTGIWPSNFIKTQKIGNGWRGNEEYDHYISSKYKK